jgi:hypothetical protein
MSTLKPILHGVLASFLSGILLWQVMTFLVFLLGINWNALPFLIFVPALIIGGYVAVRNIEPRFLVRHLAMGGAVGLIVMLLAAPLFEKEGGILFIIGIIFAGSAISVFGSYLGTRKYFINKPRKS